MSNSDGRKTRTGTSTSYARLERSLRRALATTESAEARFHLRTALQYVAVLREATSSPVNDFPARHDHL